MTLRSSDLQSDSDLDSIRNSCDVFLSVLNYSSYNYRLLSITINIKLISGLDIYVQAHSAVGLTTLTESSLQAGAEILQCAVLRNTRVRNLNKPLDLNQTKLLIRVQEKCLKMGSLWGCVTILGAFKIPSWLSVSFIEC